MAPITGLGLFSSISITTRRFGSFAPLGVPNSVTSAPAENARAVPISTMACTAGSALAASSASAMPARKS